jgi:hypothetical protein
LTLKKAIPSLVQNGLITAVPEENKMAVTATMSTPKLPTVKMSTE